MAKKTSEFTVITSLAGTEFIPVLETPGAADNPKRISTQNASKYLSGPEAQLSYVTSANSNGGSSTAGSFEDRSINTEDFDPFSIVSISGNSFIPISGEYIIEVEAETYASNETRLQLWNNTAGSSVFIGPSHYFPNGNNAGGTAKLRTKFTANGTDAYKIQQRVGTSQSGNGYGKPNNWASEVYLIIRLRKVG